jgi:hypothetical protein
MDAIVKQINSWVDVGSGLFARRVHIASNNVPSDADAYITGTQSYAAATNPLIANLAGFKTITLTVSGNATDTISAQIGYHAVNPPTLLSDAIKMEDLEDIAGDTEIITIPVGGGTYRIDNFCGHSLLLTKSGVAEAVTVTYFARKN